MDSSILMARGGRSGPLEPATLEELLCARGVSVPWTFPLQNARGPLRRNRWKIAASRRNDLPCRYLRGMSRLGLDLIARLPQGVFPDG